MTSDIDANEDVGLDQGVPRGKARQQPRLCVVTRQLCPPETMLRFVRHPESGQLIPDIERKLPARGVWLQARRQIVMEAIKRKAFEKHLKKPTIVSSALVDEIEKSLERQVLDGLSLAKKAGCLITGFDTLDRALREKGKKWALLWHAEDAAEDGCRKLDRVLKAIHPKTPIVKRLPSEVISAVLGHSLIMHLCVEEKLGAKTLQDRLRHWISYTTEENSQSATT